ncbi:hypothetical protein X777_03552 [Ooceraea biroi]|uniref:Tc1-like transposase DDE domain-containing protein n=1 Tax=Ooceraea biroi TaxID=2015173 RepID=A0A026WKD7_OOCBI|nr:hypothetical protein X777_03552 [Ooceraea biroi]
MWYMHDGAPSHFSRATRELLNTTYPDRWIGRGGLIPWPARSPDMNPLDFFFWGYLKTLVYSTPVPDVAPLRQRIVNGCDIIHNTPGIFQRVRQSMRRRAQACLESNEGHFEYLF